MPNQLQKVGAQPSHPARYGVLWHNNFYLGIVTQRNPLHAFLQHIEEEFYGSQPSLIGGANTEISTKLTLVRRPGSSVYNSQTFPAINRFAEFPIFNADTENIKVVADTATTVYDATGPSTKTAVFTKSAGAGSTYFQPVGNTMYFSDGPDQKKWIESALSWTANTLYDGAATSDTNFGDYIIDSNSNIQVAVGGFNAVITEVQVSNDVLTLTLDNSQLTDPPGTPSGVVGTSGTLSSGNYYIRIAAVDQNGNLTEAGSESSATAVVGPNGSIVWTWTAVSGANGYQVYVGTSSGGEASYFLSPTNSFTQISYPGIYAAVPPTINSTTAEFPSDLYRMENVNLALSGFTSATFLNGQNITITGILPGGLDSTQITAAFTHADYPLTADDGLASSGTGISGGTEPAWSTVLNAVTVDGGAQWVNSGYYIENWGIVSPSAAPTVSQSPVPSKYSQWAANTFYWPSSIIYVPISGTGYLFQLTTSGETGPSAPSWNTGAVGDTTTEAGVTGGLSTVVPDVPGTGYTVGDTVTVGTGSGGTAQVTSISGGGGTGPVTGLSLVNPGTSYPSGGTGLATTGGTGVGLTVNITTNPPAAVWTYVGLAAWNPSTFYAKNSYTSYITTLYGTLNYPFVYQALNGGTSGTVSPTTAAWPTGVGSLIVDGEITWKCLGYAPNYSGYAGGILTPNCLVSNQNTVVDSNGNLQIIQGLGGISGISAPAWGLLSALTIEYWTAHITAFSTSTDLATFTAPGSPILFASILNQFVSVSGITAPYAYLNGSWFLDNATPGTDFTVFSASGFPSGSGSITGIGVLSTGAVWLNTGQYDPTSTGAWKYVFAYQNSVDGSVSTASPTSAAITLQNGNKVIVQGFGSADPQVDTINIYRTVQGGATYFLLDQIANPGGGVLWTYDDTTTDVDLNELVEAAIADENNPPPTNLSAITYHLSRIWGVVNNSVYYSNYPLETTGNALTAWNPENVFVFPSSVTRLYPTTNGLLVFTVSDVYIIQGLGTSTSGFFSSRLLQNVGLVSYDAFTLNGAVAYLYTADNQVLSMDPSSGLSEVGFAIGDQFGGTSTFSPSSARLTWHFSGSQEKALYVSDFAGTWWRMLSTPSPETGTTWCPKATSAIGFSAVQSVETSPGTHNLLLGPPVGTPGYILKRDSSAFSDIGLAYPSYGVFGSIVLAQPGQFAGPELITTDCVATGTPINLAVQLDEIAGYTGPITSLGIVAGGTGYLSGDLIAIPYQGALGGLIEVSAVGAGGVIEGITILDGGEGYINNTISYPTEGAGTGLAVEIHTGSLFEPLTISVPDPTQLEPSSSVYAQRFYLSEPQQPAICRHMQILVNFGSDTVKNEMLSLSIFGFFDQEK